MKGIIFLILLAAFNSNIFAKSNSSIERANQFFSNTMKLSVVTSTYFGSENFISKATFDKLENSFSAILKTKDQNLSLVNCNVCGKASPDVKNIKDNIETLNCLSVCKVYVSQYLGFLSGVENNPRANATECVDSVNASDRSKTKVLNLNLPTPKDNETKSSTR